MMIGDAQPTLERALLRIRSRGDEPDLAPLAELTLRWSDGWCRSRMTAPAARTRWGLQIEVGAQHEIRRHLLLDQSPAEIKDLASTIDVPHTWIKAAMEPHELRAVLGPQWISDAPVFLMIWDVRPVPVTVPTGYTLHVTTDGDVTKAHVVTADGAVAARARYGHAGTHGSPDQLSTEPSHQRRGLGSVLIAALANAAHERGESVSILAASVQGRALYDTLGWQTVAPLAGFYYSP